MDTRGSERRRGERHLACFPIQERTGGDAKPRTAMIRELSVVGAQILTQTRREPGSELSLSLYLEEDAEPRDVNAKVIRCEARTEPGVWPYLTVVEFDAPLSDLATEIKEIAAAQEKIFGPASSRQPKAEP
jgi:hypothetical protein